MLVARLAELRRLGGGGESCPLLLDDPFAELDRSAKPALLELLSHASGSPQLVYLTDDEDVASWARLEALTGALSIIEPGKPSRQPRRSRARAGAVLSRSRTPDPHAGDAAATGSPCRPATGGSLRQFGRWRGSSDRSPTPTPRRSGRSTTPRCSSRRSPSTSCPARSTSSWRGSDERSGAHAVLVAVDDDGEVVGFGSLSPYKDRAAYATTVEDSVYVAPRPAGRGVGRLLLGELLAVATAHGFHAVMARIVGGPRRVDRACTPRLGFEIVGTEREVGRKFGRWLDVVVMQKLLYARLDP